MHKFGYLDKDSDEKSPTKMASYIAMEEWCRDITGITEDLIANKAEIDASDFDDIDPDNEDWLNGLQVKKNGEIKPTYVNAVTICASDPKIKDEIKYNLLSNSFEKGSGESWSDSDTRTIRTYVGTRYKVDFPEKKVLDAIYQQGDNNAYHPIQNYLNSLVWDNKKRIETLFIDYFGCNDNIYIREATTCWFIAAVARIFEPGTKFDNAIVISGAQGIGKTSFVRELGKIKWYGELSTFDHKMAQEEILGKWIIEISEMGATNRHDLELQKSFLSATHTRVRLAYERNAVDYERQCVFIGSTNLDTYLKDSTGNRRWWPMVAADDIKFIDLDKLRGEIDQIWAEAYKLYSKGKKLYLSDEANRIANETQEENREEDTWKGLIETWLEEKAYSNRYDSKIGSFAVEEDGKEKAILETRSRVCIQEIWEDCLDKRAYESGQKDKLRISAIMKSQKKNGWKYVSLIRFGKRFGRQRGWIKEVEM
jgi:predicted P-loop ATPase